MHEAIELTDYQRQLAAGGEAVFYQACMQYFGFLVTEHGYQMSFHDMGRGCYQACFKQDIQTEYFAVRLFHEFDHLWCDIERFAGLDRQRKLRFSEAIALLGVTFPREHLDIVLPHEQAISQRVHALAECVRSHLSDFRNLPLEPTVANDRLV